MHKGIEQFKNTVVEHRYQIITVAFAIGLLGLILSLAGSYHHLNDWHNSLNATGTAYYELIEPTLTALAEHVSTSTPIPLSTPLP